MSYYNEHHDDLGERPQREVTLSTLSILGIFFGLALVCAACFGLGYNMGTRSHSAAATDAAASPSATPGTTTNFNSFKPSPGSPAIQPVPGYLSPQDAAAANAAAANKGYNPPATPANTPPATPTLPVAHAATTAARDEIASSPATAPAPHPAAPAATPAPAGSFIVQVAAVSHQEDADLLVSALKQKGYPVVSRTVPGDRFFHIQIGPFGSKPAADATRQRLLTDGYNAIIK